MTEILLMTFFIFLRIIFSTIFYILFIVFIIKVIKKSIEKSNMNLDSLNSTLNKYNSNVNYNVGSNNIKAQNKIIPDDVHEERPTNKSTQKVDCKIYDEDNKYENSSNEIIDFEINTNHHSNIEENIANDSPIKEKESLLSKLFKGPDRL